MITAKELLAKIVEGGTLPPFRILRKDSWVFAWKEDTDKGPTTGVCTIFSWQRESRHVYYNILVYMGPTGQVNIPARGLIYSESPGSTPREKADYVHRAIGHGIDILYGYEGSHKDFPSIIKQIITSQGFMPVLDKNRNQWTPWPY
jgi:hypothetical protein